MLWWCVSLRAWKSTDVQNVESENVSTPSCCPTWVSTLGLSRAIRSGSTVSRNVSAWPTRVDRPPPDLVRLSHEQNMVYFRSSLRPPPGRGAPWLRQGGRHRGHRGPRRAHRLPVERARRTA